MQIFKAALEGLFSAKRHENIACNGQPGEDTLISILNRLELEIPSENLITILRRLAKKSSVSIVLSKHRIAFVRSRDVKVSYVIGNKFELQEFSTKDLDLESGSSIDKSQACDWHVHNQCR